MPVVCMLLLVVLKARVKTVRQGNPVTRSPTLGAGPAHPLLRLAHHGAFSAFPLPRPPAAPPNGFGWVDDDISETS